MILLLSASIAYSATPPPGLSRQESKAYQTIATTDWLFVDVGDDSHVNVAFRKLLNSRKADAAFKKLLNGGTTAGKLYALCGIYYTDPPFFHRAVEPFRHSTDVIRVISGCTGDWVKVGSLVESEEKAWCGDIMSGSLPSLFRYPCGEMPPFALVLTILSVESSYLQEVERPATEVPDTIQLWLTPDSQWRIRTYAIDHDIHLYTLDARPDGSRMTVDEAAAHTAKHYRKVTASRFVLRLHNPNDPKEVRRVLAAHKLPGKLEIGKNGVTFYNPDSGEYRTKSKPQ